MTARILFLTSLLLFATTDGVSDEVSASEWNFNVYLNDSLVGEHVFRVSNTAAGQTLETEASFDVKFLFITAYKYRHESRELWLDGCLRKVDARTNANGERLRVSGESQEDGFRLSAPKLGELLPDCVKSFAYWNPEFLDASRLLNTQTGEYTDFEITSKSSETIRVRGTEVSAVRYELRAKGLELDIWYSTDGDWLGLESVLKNGRTLRYELA